MREDIKDIKEALDESSRYNRKLFFLFLVPMVYILLTVITTTDSDLVITGKILLPVLNIALPYIWFYLTAPLFIIVFHIYLLFNLSEHNEKLMRWDQGKRWKESFLIFPFFYNYIVNNHKADFFSYFLKAIIWLTIFVLPPLTLLCIQIIFSKYHNLGISVFHGGILFVDFFCFLAYKLRATGGPYKSFNKKRLSIRGKITIFSILVIFVIVEGISSCNLIVLKEILRDTIEDQTNTQKSFAEAEGYFKPCLTLSFKTLIASPPSEEIKAQYLAKDQGKEIAWINYSTGLDLSNRDLRCADFFQSKLFNAQLSAAKLQGANFQNAELQGSDLSYAELQGAKLENSKLQRAYLGYAKLQGSYLSATELQGADLRHAKLQGAELFNAQLQGTNLRNAELQGADLRYADLRGADLWNAQLQGADLRNAKLQGANLRNAKLQGANLIGANLQGAYLGDSEIYCADFSTSEGGGIFFEAVNLTREAQWEKLLEDIKNKIPAFAYDNIKEAKERCSKLKASRTDSISQSDSNWDKFIKIRKLLACNDKYITEGILNNFSLEDSNDEKGKIVKKAAINDTEKRAEARKAIIIYMRANCPALLPEMSKEGTYVDLNQDIRSAMTRTILPPEHNSSTNAK